MKTILSTILLFLCITAQGKVREINTLSPDGKMKLSVNIGQNITWQVTHNGTEVLSPSAIGMNTSCGNWGQNSKLLSARTVKENGQQRLLLKFADCQLEFRVLNDAVAYRFLLPEKARKNNNITVNGELAEFRFAEDHKVFVPYVNDNRGGERWCYSFESYYDEQKLSEMYADSLAISPLAVCLPGGKKAVIMETAVENYPGMYLKKGCGNGLVAAFPPVATDEEIGGYARLNVVPTRRAEHIAEGATVFPWRVLMVTENDAQLVGNTIVARLMNNDASAYPENKVSRIADTNWIRPGKIAWDWWNNRNLFGVDFEAGINTDTYLYFVDFAKRNNIEYVIVDEGWSNPEDLLVFSDKMDMQRLIEHANKQGVGIILWSSWRNLVQRGEAKMQEIMAYYQHLGVKGFKVDFFDRDDQAVIKSVYAIAECAAKHQLLLDLHGLKPMGMEVYYPNILNFEGVKGLENSKWEPRGINGPVHDQPRYDCTIPYLRNLIGPMDYTPGAMRNATKSAFFGNNDNPMSQGTRVHQMAMYTVFYAPLQMLADSPTAYEREAECAEFLYKVPTVWDETVPLVGEMGEYVAVARRSGADWYVGVLNNWQERDLELDLSVIFNRRMVVGNTLEVFADGTNAHREATDYKHFNMAKPEGGKVKIHLAPGGGWTARIAFRQK